MPFFNNSSYNKVKKLLESHGYTISQGGNHAKAYCNEHQVTIVFPRSRKISPGVTRSISIALTQKCSMEDQLVTKALK